MTTAAQLPGQLRVSLIWCDEVMSDEVIRGRSTITLGRSRRSTIVIPDLGLPDEFAILRPGIRGYLLTLDERMRGTVSLDGERRDVIDVVDRGAEGGGVVGERATPIGGRDWGVVELDGSGDYKLFFQFVEPPPSIQGPFVAALELLLPAFALSLLLHVAILAMTYQFDTSQSPFVWPSTRAMAADYIVTRLKDSPPEPEPPKPPPSKLAAPAASSMAMVTPPKPKEPKINSATKRPEGASGGEGEHDRAQDPDAKDDDDHPKPPDAGLFTGKNQQVVDHIINQNMNLALGKFNGMKGDPKDGDAGHGHGGGHGEGDEQGGHGNTRGSQGKGNGGGGSAEGSFVSNKGPVNTGETRPASGGGPGNGTGPKEVAVAPGAASGDFSGLSREEIDAVIRKRANLLKTCYQRELNRSPKLAGKLVVSFFISADGVVTSTRIDPGKSSLRNDAVEGCVRSQIQHMKFPAKGGATVNYPFVFSQGG